MGTSLLMTADNERSESQRSLASIYRAAERMNRLIRDLLDVSSIETGRFSVSTTPQSLGVLIEEAVVALQPAAQARSVRLTNEFPRGDELEIPADRDRIEQVLTNLIDNAIKFTPSGGTITVRAERRGGEVWLSVTDSGPGIAPAQLPHVFDRYWQAPETARLGHGLGLAIAKGIVDAHNGRIWVDSVLGAGTTFCVALPLARSLHDAKKVLVVDDDPDMRDMLCDRLASAGYEVEQAGDGAQALACLKRGRRPSLILLDLAMPVMNGWEFLAERDRDPALRKIPVVVISAQQDVADRLAALHADYLAKPITIARLLDEVAQTAQ